MTPEQRKAAYRAKCRAAEIERRERLGLAPRSTPAKPKRRKPAPYRETYEDRLDDLGESFD